MNIRKFTVLASILAAAALASAQRPAPTAPLRTVSSVDINRYSGKWFEIARYPNKFQKQCAGNTTATYTVNAPGKLEILNQCLTKDGRIESAKGAGKIADRTTNSKLKVRFAPGFLSPFGFVWADYWIIDLDPQYQFAAVGDPNREYLWVLSRRPEMSEEVYQNIQRRVEKLGFDPGKLEKTPQNLQAIKGSVVGKN